jgi:DNA replication and repair protein RecF
VSPWTQAVVTHGAALVEARRETLSLLSPRFEAAADKLGLAGARLGYEGEPAAREDLDGRIERDLERGTTGLGPHLHEIRIESVGRDLRAFGSQGEQRVAVLALVLAEAELIGERGAPPPLVLLDDVLSELDGDRRRALGELVSGVGQTVVTATAAAALPVEPAQRLAVTPGEVHAV